MSLPNKDGTFKATVMEWGVKDDKNPALVCKFDLLEYWNGREWQPSGGDFQMTGYFYPLKNDGTVNEKGRQSLMNSLGWDGMSFASFRDGNFEGVECQVVLGYEEYQGQNKLKIKFVNPIDRVPGGKVEKGDPQAIRSLDAQYGSLFRALGGAPTAKPATTPAKQPAASTATPTAGEAKQQAWQAFQAKTPDYDDGERKNVFRSAVASLFPAGTDLKALSNEQWETVRGRIVEDFDAAVRDFLPF